MLFAVSAGKNHKITQNLRNYSVNTRQRRDKLHYMRKLIGSVKDFSQNSLHGLE